MATSREERAAPGVFARVPAELAVPRSDAVVIIDFAIMQFAEQPLIDHRPCRGDLARETAFETDARFRPRLFDGFAHRPQVLEVETERLLNDQMFARFGGGDHLGG